jgi:hypothetical protein
MISEFVSCQKVLDMAEETNDDGGDFEVLTRSIET